MTSRHSNCNASREAPAGYNLCVKVFYSPQYVAPRHFYETTRKSAWIASSLLADPIPFVELVVPSPASQKALEQVHSPAYVEAVKTGEDRLLACSNGFDWDKGIWTMATSMAGGLVAAAHEALANGVSGSLSTGMHHAEYGFGKGFCTFNALVLAALSALADGARKVLILDFDAHHGGGTHKLILGHPHIRQVDLAVNGYDSYVCDSNCSLFHLDGRTYLETVALALDAAGHDFDLVLYNAGVDPYEGCPTGGLRGVTKEVLSQREHMVFAWTSLNRLPIAFAIAGGYCPSPRPEHISELVSLHRLTIAAASIAVAS